MSYSGRIVYDGRKHHCRPSFPDGVVWECPECGAWWRHTNDGSYSMCGPFHRWLTRRRIAQLEVVEAENERLRDRIESLRDGLVEVAAGDPDVTPAGLPTALRSRAKATLDIDDEDEAALHPQEGTDE